MKKKLIISLSTICVALLIVFGIFEMVAYYHRYQPASYQSIPGQETNISLENPFRGFYHMYGFTLSEDAPETTTERIRKYIDSGNLPLMLIQINLKNYAGSDLSDNALLQLDNILSELSDARRQIVLRFLYDWDGKALETEPDTIDQIIRHMDQVAAIVNQYEDSVLLIQSTFTGNCGEMTQTKFGSHDDNRFLMTHLSEVITPSIFLAVRTPSHLRGVLNTRETVTEENAFDGSLASRLGLFNDGLLGSVYDLGTYDDTPNSDTDEPEDKGTREEEIAFQNALCQFVPNGGEAVLDNPYSDFDNALKDLANMHISYLNCDHDAAVLNKWKDSIYHGKDCFDGMRGYEYIEAHLGYRYVLENSALSYDALNPSAASLSLTIENTGFAPSYRHFDGMLTLIHEDTGEEYSFPADMDNRRIGGGSKTTFTLPLDLNAYPEGNYQISFSLTDPYTGQFIQFANDNARDGQVQLGTLTIEAKSPEGYLSYLLGRWQNK